MANVITTVLRMDAAQVRSGLAQVRTDVAAAEGFTNKLKTGWQGVVSSFASSPVAIGAATAAAVTFGDQAVRAAVAVEDSVNAVNVVFGESSDKVLEFGENAAKSAGLAASEFNQLAAPLGAMLGNAGLALDDVADKTIELTQRAADMASVFGGSVQDALTAIQAGLRGELDPLERYGVKLSAAAVEQRALADTGKESAKQLTEQEKALARVAEIMDQTDRVAGDFERTSGDLANQARILSAEWENFQAQAGKTLIPILSDLASALIAVSDGVEAVKEGLAGIPGTGGFEFNPFTGAIGLIKQDIEIVNRLWKGNADATDEAGDAAAEAAPKIGGVGDAASTAAEAMGGAGGSSLVGQLRDFSSEARDASNAAEDFGEALEDALAQKAEESVDRFEAAIDRVIDKLDEAFGQFDKAQRQQDILADIADGWDEIAEKQEEATDGGEQERRDLEQSIRDQRGAVRDLLETIDRIPVNKKIDILAQIQDASLGELQRIVSDLSSGITVPVTFVRNPGFESVGGVFSPTQANPIINGATGPTQTAIPSGPINVTNYYPTGSTPTTVQQQQETYTLRNGVRLS